MRSLLRTRLFLSFLVLLAFAKFAHAQETYNLRGEGAKVGMSFIEITTMKMKSNFDAMSGTTLRTSKNEYYVNQVDEMGEIINATVQSSSITNMPDGTMQKTPSEPLREKKLICEKNENKWVFKTENANENEQLQAELKELTGPELQRENLPLVSVPLGYKWEIKAEEFLQEILKISPESKDMIKEIKGRYSFIFDGIEKINNNFCARIKSKVEFSGVIVIPGDNPTKIYGMIKGTTIEYRRLDNGIAVKQEITGEVKANGNGLNGKATFEGVVTRKFTSI